VAATHDPVDQVLAAWRRELPGVLGPTSELSKRIILLAGELNAATRRLTAEFGITPAEFDVLATLRRIGPPHRMKPNELSRHSLLSSGGTSNVLNSLERSELIRREPAPDDRRSTMIVLTESGIKTTEQALLYISEAHARVFDDVPPAVLRAATKALRDLDATR
jgi:DNA-binding MarR family transcriptional regulator